LAAQEGDEFRETLKEPQKPKAGRQKRLAALGAPFQLQLLLE
jgi:hypothetical protein